MRKLIVAANLAFAAAVTIAWFACESSSDPNETFKGGAAHNGRASKIIGKKCADQFEEMSERDKAFLECADAGNYFHLTYKNGKANAPQWDCIEPKKAKVIPCSVSDIFDKADKYNQLEQENFQVDDAEEKNQTLKDTRALGEKIGDEYMVNCWEGERQIPEGKERILLSQMFFPNEKVASDADECAIFSRYILGNLCFSYWTEPTTGLRLEAADKDVETVVDEDDIIKDKNEWNETAKYALDTCVTPFK